MQQSYETRIPDGFVILGNSAALKCVLPSHVSDVVSVQSWEASDGAVFFPSSDYGTLAFRCRLSRCLSAPIHPSICRPYIT